MPETALRKNGAPQLPEWGRDGDAFQLVGPNAENLEAVFELLGSDSRFVQAQLLSALGSAVQAKDRSLALNAAQGLLAELRPRDMAERLLAVQMIASFEQAMRMVRRSENADAEGVRVYLGLSERFMRVYCQQLEALHRHRHGGRQTVRVERVTVNGQALIGSVERGRGGDGA